ncbi:M1 family metallopeptidase [Pseudoduganella sp. LjRoot289]|uniref:M1 family metallopeptidase n=1 Tax=Pseudoduganella sp. LjRoot289 TaxID=3342314 RepID=UPI003ED0F7CE
MNAYPYRKLLAAAAAMAALAIQGTLLAQVQVIAVPEPYTDTGIPFAPAHAAAVATPSAPNAWGGPRTGGEPTLSDRVADYKIKATLDPVKHTVDGQQQLTWRNRSAHPVRTVYLHLYLNAFEHGGTTFFTEHRAMGGRGVFSTDPKDGDWGHIELRSVLQNGAKVDQSFVHPDDGPANDRTVVRFDLPQPVAPGATTTLDIDFHSQLPRLLARSGYFGSFHLVAQWFPKIGVLELPGERGAVKERWNVHEYHAESEFYADFGSYDVKLTVPKGYTVGATGELQGAPVEKDGMLTHHYVQGDVHDFAWTADKRYAAPLTGSWTGAGSPPVSIKVLYAPEFAASAAPSLKAAQDALSYYSKTLGPYPYRTLTVVLPPHNAGAASGMEYPTFYTADSYTKVEPDTADAFELDLVNIHEFGHGYFYGILASNEFEEPMLDEGLNEYWNMRMARERGQKFHPAPWWLRALGVSPGFDGFHYELGGAVRENPADPAGQNAYARLQGIGPVYNRGAILFHDLEAQLGKQATEQAFKEYYKRWRFRHPSTADLREALAESSGQRALVERVFAQQVYRTGKVDDRVQEFASTEVLPQPGSTIVKGKRVMLTQEQVDEQIEATREKWEKAHPHAGPGTGPFPFRTEVVLRRRGEAVPQTLLVRFADGSTISVKWDPQNGERWQRYTWDKPVQAVSAELDPERTHLLDTNKLDDSRTLKADKSAARRWTFDLAALAQAMLTLIATI